MLNLKKLFNNSVSMMSIEEILLTEIEEFSSSDTRDWMLTGDRYYRVENDINKRKITRNTEVGEVEDKSKANNKLAHGFAKNLVDEKVAYLLTKEYSLQCDNEMYIEKVKSVLGKYFQYDLTTLGTESSNKGIAWLQVYINEQGKFRVMIIPSEQCIPLWKDSTHTILDGMIRFYDIVSYEGKEKKNITKVEYYTENEVNFYVLQDKKLIVDVEKNEGKPKFHYKQGEQWKSWGKVPFVPFKNNRLEFPDIRFVKSIVDNYDLSRSDISNFIEETKNLIYILKGYGGEDLSEFMNDLNYYRAIKIDDPEHGGVDTLNPTIDIQAAKEHYEQLKRDINEFGGGVPKDLDKFGSSPSGIALKFLYGGLDLKCNHLEIEFKRAFEQLLHFIDIYLSETGQGNYIEIDVELIFNRDIQINETESIENCMTSQNMISNETIVANHPWISDVEKELERIKKEQESEVYPTFNNGSNKEDDIDE